MPGGYENAIPAWMIPSLASEERKDLAERIYRYEVPALERVTYRTHGRPFFTASRKPWVVEFWATVRDEPSGMWDRTYTAIGTGHPLPKDALDVLGSAIDPNGFVWHLIELEPDNSLADVVQLPLSVLEGGESAYSGAIAESQLREWQGTTKAA